MNQRMQSAYDQIAPDFAQVNAGLADDLLFVAERMSAYIGPQARLLDIGCGHGRDMAWFESRAIRTVGIDLSRGMLLEARRRVQGMLLQMDMRHLAFHDQQFDGIWCCASLLHLPRIEAPAALTEMRRVLAPGGICVLAVQEGASEGWERRGLFNTVERFFTRYTMAEIAALMGQCGLTVREQRSNAGKGVTWLNLLAVAE